MQANGNILRSFGAKWSICATNWTLFILHKKMITCIMSSASIPACYKLALNRWWPNSRSVHLCSQSHLIMCFGSKTSIIMVSGFQNDCLWPLAHVSLEEPDERTWHNLSSSFINSISINFPYQIHDPDPRSASISASCFCKSQIISVH